MTSTTAIPAGRTLPVTDQEAQALGAPRPRQEDGLRADRKAQDQQDGFEAYLAQSGISQVERTQPRGTTFDPVEDLTRGSVYGMPGVTVPV